jgi:PAS domain S-box-containing protein
MTTPTDPIRVLCVDDDPDFAELTATFLEREDDGLEVVTATHPDAGRARLDDARFDCVVSDYDMPGTNGLEFLETVRESHPDLPFILFTGQGSEEIASEAIAAGVTDYLPKEPGTDQYTLLANRVRNAVAKQRAERTAERTERTLRTVLDYLPYPVFVVDEAGRYRVSNEAHATVHDATVEEIEGAAVRDILGPAPAEQFLEDYRAVMESGEETRFEDITFDIEGETRTFDARLAPFDTLEDGSEAVLGVTVDVTERRTRERMLEDLHEATRDLVQATSQEEVAEIAVSAAVESLDLPLAGCWLLDDDGSALRPVAASEGARAVIGDLPTYRPGDGLSWTAFEDGEVRVYDDVSAESARYAAETPVRSELVLPLGEYGVLNIGSTAVGAFDAMDVSLARVLAANTETALARTTRELRLREERALADLAIDALDEMFYVFDADGRPLRWNARLQEVTGYDDAEIAEMEPTDFFVEADRDHIAETMDRLNDVEHVRSEADILTADGEAVPVELTGASFTGPDGDLLGVAGIARTIDDRQERERTLEQLHAVTRDLLHADTREEVAETVTEAVHDILGYPRNLVRLVGDDGGLHPVAITDEAERMLGDRPIYPVGEGTAGRAYAAGETLVYDDVQRVDDGYDRRDARASMFVPIGDHGVLSVGETTVGAFDDTDIHLAEIFAANAATALTLVEQRRARERQNERLSEFTSIVSHDLRNPLNVVDGCLDLAAAAEGDSTEDLERAKRALGRAFALIDDLLTLAKEGEETLEVGPVDLAALVEACWTESDVGDATLVVDADGTVVADESSLRQLLENLLRNAVKHGTTDGESVTVTVGDLPDGFYVEDDGPGIPGAERDRVFEAGHSTSDDGTGFGLRIVERIAELHEWDVAVTEGTEGGARFEIRGVETE